MHGFANASASQRYDAQTSHQVHRAVAELLLGTFQAGGHYSYESPPTSLGLCEEPLRTLVHLTHPTLTVVRRCPYDPRFYKEYLFLSSCSDISVLGEADCTHDYHEPGLAAETARGHSCQATPLSTL